MKQEIHERIHKMLDGTISADEFAVLQDEMRKDPAVRALFYEYSAMEQRLQFRLGRQASQAGLAGLAQLRLARQRKRTVKMAAFVALAASVVLAIGLSFFFISNPANELKFAYAPGTKFELSHDGAAGELDGGVMKAGSRMIVSQGTVELKFDSGVRAVISSPADFTLTHDGVLEMPEGSGWFDVPAKAKGFTVQTKELYVVDLGTRFGVYARADEADQVHVFKGLVEAVSLRGRAEKRELQRGDAVSVDSIGRLVVTDTRDELFLTELPTALPHIHFSFDEETDLIKENTLTSTGGVNCRSVGGDLDLTDGVFGRAVRLEGAGNYLQTDWMGIQGKRPRSVAFWMKMPEKRLEKNVTQATDTIVGWGMQRDESKIEEKFNSKWTIHLDYASDRYPMLNISFGGFWYYFPGIVLDDDRWHHVAVTYSGDSDEKGYPVVKLYIDGGEVAVTQSNATKGEPLRDAKGDVVVNTLEKSPLAIGAKLTSAAGRYYDERSDLGAEIDELYVVEGVIDLETVRSLMEENNFSGGETR